MELTRHLTTAQRAKKGHPRGPDPHHRILRSQLLGEQPGEEGLGGPKKEYPTRVVSRVLQVEKEKAHVRRGYLLQFGDVQLIDEARQSLQFLAVESLGAGRELPCLGVQDEHLHIEGQSGRVSSLTNPQRVIRGSHAFLLGARRRTT